MHPRVDVPFFLRTRTHAGEHPHDGRFLRLVPGTLVELSWMRRERAAPRASRRS
jgi:hypothetical protein